jgi:putative membrane protein
MIVKLQIPWYRIFKDLRLSMIFIVFYNIGISILDHFYPLDEIHIPLGLITIPGTVIALLIGFRTNSAYDRWWEARIIWGAIVNDSRTWVRQLMTFIPFENKKSTEFHFVRDLSLRQVAWNYSLTRHLRKQNPTEGLEGLIAEDEVGKLKGKNNVPNALLFTQAERLKYAHENKLIDAYQFVQLDRTLTNITDSMGRCERIKNTVFPSSYSLLVEILIYLWIMFLPFGLVDMIGYILIPTTISLAFSFLVIDKIAIYMQDPFENMPSDTPMLSLSRTIEINIRQELEDKHIPLPLEPKNGALM